MYFENNLSLRNVWKTFKVLSPQGMGKQIKGEYDSILWQTTILKVPHYHPISYVLGRWKVTFPNVICIVAIVDRTKEYIRETFETTCVWLLLLKLSVFHCGYFNIVVKGNSMDI